MPPPKPPLPASWRRNVRLATLGYALLLAYLSLNPDQRIPGILDWGRLFSPDKIAHFGAYAFFAVLLSFSIGGPSVLRRAAMAVVISALFGALMEILQGISGLGRQLDPVDMVANLIGAILGGAIFSLLRRLKYKYPTSVGSQR